MQRVAWRRKEIQIRVKASCRLSLAWTIEFVPAIIERLSGVMSPKFFDRPGQHFFAGAKKHQRQRIPAQSRDAAYERCGELEHPERLETQPTWPDSIGTCDDQSVFISTRQGTDPDKFTHGTNHEPIIVFHRLDTFVRTVPYRCPRGACFTVTSTS